ncbi:Fur family transcriptional regulator [Leifsonia sp. A12D58]|uniref:Fur family transcriptional regulator n=1 Tax=Leifsonia sp. A12D58 TaxID=3397674 RepID=UPI0039E05165
MTTREPASAAATNVAPSDATSTDVVDSLRAAGLKVTAPRAAVMTALVNIPHADAEQLYSAVRTELPGTSLQAIYGVLTALTGVGLVRRIEPAGSAALYERRIGDNHHHAVCTNCKSVTDIDCVIGEAPCLVPSDTSGFAVQSAEVTFWGLCSACQAELAASALD